MGSLIFPAPPVTYSENQLINEGCFYKIGNIPCIRIEKPNSKYLGLYFHGNAEDLGQVHNLVAEISERFNMSVLAPEYPGYGISEDKSKSAETILKNSRILMEHLQDQLGYKLENIIVIGRSVGTGPAIHLAAEYQNVGALTLISSYTSIQQIAQSKVGCFLYKCVPDVFRNIEQIQKIKCPVFFIHGLADEVIPVYHTKFLWKHIQNMKMKVLWKYKGHNDLDYELHFYPYWAEFLKQIYGEEIIGKQQKINTCFEQLIKHQYLEYQYEGFKKDQEISKQMSNKQINAYFQDFMKRKDQN